MVRSLPVQKPKKQDTNITGQVLLHGVSHSLHSSSTSPAPAGLWSVFCHHPLQRYRDLVGHCFFHPLHFQIQQAVLSFSH